MGRRTLFNSIVRYIDTEEKWGKGVSAFIADRRPDDDKETPGEAFVRQCIAAGRDVRLSVVGAVLLGLRDRFKTLPAPNPKGGDGQLTGAANGLFDRIQPVLMRAFKNRLVNRHKQEKSAQHGVAAFNDDPWTTHDDMMYVLNSAKPEIDEYERELEKVLT